MWPFYLNIYSPQQGALAHLFAGAVDLKVSICAYPVVICLEKRGCTLHFAERVLDNADGGIADLLVIHLRHRPPIIVGIQIVPRGNTHTQQSRLQFGLEAVQEVS